jgi:hypothetical protein
VDRELCCRVPIYAGHVDQLYRSSENKLEI